jgi:hypothetical protein
VATDDGRVLRVDAENVAGDAGAPIGVLVVLGIVLVVAGGLLRARRTRP